MKRFGLIVLLLAVCLAGCSKSNTVPTLGNVSDFTKVDLCIGDQYNISLTLQDPGAIQSLVSTVNTFLASASVYTITADDLASVTQFYYLEFFVGSIRSEVIMTNAYLRFNGHYYRNEAYSSFYTSVLALYPEQ